jgi:hypothetical protein
MSSAWIQVPSRRDTCSHFDRCVNCLPCGCEVFEPQPWVKTIADRQPFSGKTLSDDAGLGALGSTARRAWGEISGHLLLRLDPRTPDAPTRRDGDSKSRSFSQLRLMRPVQAGCERPVTDDPCAAGSSSKRSPACALTEMGDATRAATRILLRGDPLDKSPLDRE